MILLRFSIIQQTLCNALIEADGTRPLDLPDRLVQKLKRRSLLQTSRFVRSKGIFNRFILFPIGDKMQSLTSLCKVLNSVLPFMSFLTFAFAMSIFLIMGVASEGSTFIGGLYWGLMVLSICAHELGHLICGVSYGFKPGDIGILLLGIIPLGAYVSCGLREDASKKEQIRFALSGTCVNLFITGICLLLAIPASPLSFTLTLVAQINLFLVGLNLLPASGLDGEVALSAALGVEFESLSAAAKHWIMSQRYRQKLRRSGVPRYMGGVFVVSLLANIIFWSVLVFNIIHVLFF